MESNQGAIGYDGKIYIVGGNDGSVFTGAIISYDPNNNTYDQSLSSMSVGRDYAAVGVKSGIIYVAGGTNSSGYITSCEKYNIGTGIWSSMNSLPATVIHGRGAIYGDYFYVFGNSKIYKYNINGNSWSTSNTDTTALDNPVVEAVGDYIWVIGGGTYKRKVRKYNPATDSWISGTYTDAPFDVYYTASCAHGTKIYMAGSNSSPQNAFKSYNTSNDTWDNTLPNMTTGRYGCAGAAVNDNFYVLGGVNGGFLKTNESYDLPTLSTTNPGGDINPYKTRIRG